MGKAGCRVSGDCSDKLAAFRTGQPAQYTNIPGGERPRVGESAPVLHIGAADLGDLPRRGRRIVLHGNGIVRLGSCGGGGGLDGGIGERDGIAAFEASSEQADIRELAHGPVVLDLEDHAGEGIRCT